MANNNQPQQNSAGPGDNNLQNHSNRGSAKNLKNNKAKANESIHRGAPS